MRITGLTSNNVNPGKASARRMKNGNLRYQSDHTLACQNFMWPLSNLENLTVIDYLARTHICRERFSYFSLFSWIFSCFGCHNISSIFWVSKFSILRIPPRKLFQFFQFQTNLASANAAEKSKYPFHLLTNNQFLCAWSTVRRCVIKAILLQLKDQCEKICLSRSLLLYVGIARYVLKRTSGSVMATSIKE